MRKILMVICSSCLLLTLSTSCGSGSGSESVCGNGVVEANEACDLGSDNNDQGKCTSQCKASVCGDGLVYQGKEECDDGNVIAGDGCSTTCNIEFKFHKINDQFKSPQAIYFADLNADGKNDVIAISSLYDDFVWYQNNGDGTLSTEKPVWQPQDPSTFYSLSVGDLNNDNKVDLLLGTGDGKIYWFQNNGDSTFSSPNFIFQIFMNTIANIQAIDLNKDGNLDLLVGTSSFVAWYKNDGKGNFASNETISGGASMEAYAADIDNDGNTDVISAASNGEVAWYRNNGDNTFGDKNHIGFQPNGAYEIYAADLNGDGNIDVLSASDKEVIWYQNQGGGTFSSEKIITDHADSVSSIYGADLDSDGDIDVLSTSGNDDKIVWYKNNGDSTFEARVISDKADGAQSVYATDIDGDGDLDLLTSSYLDSTIAWYENGRNGF